MSDIQIKTESLSTRCDVCHQSDKFDPINNYCSRCSNVLNNKIGKINLNQIYLLPKLAICLVVVTFYALYSDIKHIQEGLISIGDSINGDIASGVIKLLNFEYIRVHLLVGSLIYCCSRLNSDKLMQWLSKSALIYLFITYSFVIYLAYQIMEANIGGMMGGGLYYIRPCDGIGMNIFIIILISELIILIKKPKVSALNK